MLGKNPFGAEQQKILHFRAPFPGMHLPIGESEKQKKGEIKDSFDRLEATRNKLLESNSEMNHELAHILAALLTPDATEKNDRWKIYNRHL